jgi:hypothetical protein
MYDDFAPEFTSEEFMMGFEPEEEEEVGATEGAEEETETEAADESEEEGL